MGRWFWIALIALVAVAGYEVHQQGVKYAFGGALAFLSSEDVATRQPGGIEPIESTEEYRGERDRLIRRWRPW